MLCFVPRTESLCKLLILSTGSKKVDILVKAPRSDMLMVLSLCSKAFLPSTKTDRIEEHLKTKACSLNIVIHLIYYTITKVSIYDRYFVF